LFENIVSALKTVTNERIGFLSLEINKDDDGFALVDIGRIVFYSGIISEKDLFPNPHLMKYPHFNASRLKKRKIRGSYPS